MPVCVSPQDREASKSNAVCWPFIAPCCGFIPSDAPSPLRTPEDSQTYEHISRSILPVSVRPVSGEDDPAWSPAPVQARKRGRQIEKTHNTEGLGAENISMFFSNSIANKKGFLPRLSPFRAWTGAGEAGTYNHAGVPEISGQMDGGGYYQNAEGVGALYPSNARPEYIMSAASGFSMFNAKINILASRYNSIFGASPTVMPSSINLPVCLYLGLTA